MKRIFVGIDIQLKSKLMESVDRLKEDLSLEKIRWVPEENLHLTLIF